jgi:uncharacterized protein (TIGR01777 family)
MDVLLTGGTGFVGSALAVRLAAEGYQVRILTRGRPGDGTFPKGVSFIEAVPAERGDWQRRVADHNIVINLAGASIFQRWTKKAKKMIRDSRILTTQNLVEGLAGRKGKDTLLINASAVGYYGFHEEEMLTEKSSPGSDFLAGLAEEWEGAAMEARHDGARVILCRFGIVLGPEGGALQKMTPLYRFYLGSPLGNGNQWFSWVHLGDLLDIFLFLIRKEELSGPVNCTAPEPVTNREMTRTLGNVLNRPVILPAMPGFLIRLILGEFGNTLLKGQRVIPKRLLDMGYPFRFPRIHEALKDILIQA